MHMTTPWILAHIQSLVFNQGMMVLFLARFQITDVSETKYGGRDIVFGEIFDSLETWTECRMFYSLCSKAAKYYTRASSRKLVLETSGQHLCKRWEIISKQNTPLIYREWHPQTQYPISRASKISEGTGGILWRVILGHIKQENRQKTFQQKFEEWWIPAQ